MASRGRTRALCALLASAYVCLAEPATFDYQADPSFRQDTVSPPTERVYGDFLIGTGKSQQRTKVKRNEDIIKIPKLINYVLNPEYLKLKNKSAYLITRDYNPEDTVISDNVIAESNVLHLVRPGKRRIADSYQPKRRYKRGYNLEYVRVPNAYPYVFQRRWDPIFRRYPMYW